VGTRGRGRGGTGVYLREEGGRGKGGWGGFGRRPEDMDEQTKITEIKQLRVSGHGHEKQEEAKRAVAKHCIVIVIVILMQVKNRNELVFIWTTPGKKKKS